MPTVPESLAKLSASMAELSQRAKEAQEHTAAARNETREQLEARAAEEQRRPQVAGLALHDRADLARQVADRVSQPAWIRSNPTHLDVQHVHSLRRSRRRF